MGERPSIWGDAVAGRLAGSRWTGGRGLVVAAIGPQPHPDFIEVFGGAAAVSPRAGVEEAAGGGRVGHCPPDEGPRKVTAVSRGFATVCGAPSIKGGGTAEFLAARAAASSRPDGFSFPRARSCAELTPTPRLVGA